MNTLPGTSNEDLQVVGDANMSAKLSMLKIAARNLLCRFFGTQQDAATVCDFSPDSLPWIDRDDADVKAFLSSFSRQGEVSFDLEEKLNFWKQNGYVILKQAIPIELIDEFLEELDGIIEEHKDYNLSVDIWQPEYMKARIQKIRDLSPKILRGPKLKFLMVHTVAESALKMMNHPSIMVFLHAIFAEKAVAKQSLMFRFGSEQEVHQDYAYVVPSVPSHLAASWIALEDINPDSGPLFYYEGSHRIPIFDFGNGSFLNDQSTKTNSDFVHHIKTQVEKMGLKRKVLEIGKGDVLVWHAALAHGGELIKSPELTRQALVTHYTSWTASQRPGHI